MGTRVIVCVWRLEDSFVEMVLSRHLSVGSEELDSDRQTHMVPPRTAHLSSPNVLSDPEMYILYELYETSHQPTGISLPFSAVPCPLHTRKPLAFPQIS